MDEKSQVQALNRTDPILPLAPGAPARQSHDYPRHGVTSLFAARDVASGVTIGNRYRRRRHQELRFPSRLDAHPVMDKRGTHRSPSTPTSGSWLNLVERLFSEVTERCVRRDSHLADLIPGKVERFCKRIARSGR